MIVKTVLIVILGFSTHQSGGVSVVHRFSSADACERAKKTIVTDAQRVTKDMRHQPILITAHCHEY